MSLTSAPGAARATALVAGTPAADRLTQDTPIQTLAAIRYTLERINDRLEHEVMHRETTMGAESMYHQRLVRGIKPIS